MGGRTVFRMIGALSLLVGCALAQDTHLSIDPAAPIYRLSTFMHGYAHGYEMGFHSGDIDLHMSRVSRDPRDLKLFKEGKKKAYDKSFGDRDMFFNGYEQGFRVGYADAYGGRDFRAAQEVRSLTQQMNERGGPPASDPKHHSDFDRGMSDGYKKGLASGLDEARKGRAFQPSYENCPKKDPAGNFCAGYPLGYELGYSDGYNNQRKPEEGVRTAQD